MTIRVDLPILCGMENTDIFSGTDTAHYPMPTNRLEQCLTNERLRVIAEQAVVESVLVTLVLLGYLYFFRHQQDLWLLACCAALAGVYWTRVRLAHCFLNLSADHNNLHSWHKTFVLMSVLSGILWGIFVSMLILLSIPMADLFITFLVGGLTVAAIISLSSLLRAYIGYTLGMLIPISITLLIRGNGFDSVLAGLTLTYLAFLLFTVPKFHQRLDVWLRLAMENAELTNRLYDLYDEKRLSDKAWIELEGRLEKLLGRIG